MKDLKTYVLEGFRLGKNKVDIKDYDFVDLGLHSKTLWCKHNVGQHVKMMLNPGMVTILCGVT